MRSLGPRNGRDHRNSPTVVRPTAPVVDLSLLRHWPYPYRGILAICSDLDETPSAETYFETSRYLNTGQATRLGRGLNLEVGNTIYFGMPDGQFAYWNTDDAGRDRVRALIRSGHIDCLHSFGDLSLSRADAERALSELSRHQCRLEVWVDHGSVATNFGADIMKGSGDIPRAPAFHADLTSAFGIQFVWCGRVTTVVGQECPRELAGIFDWAHPIRSAETLAKEFAKGTLGTLGSHKYRPHACNRILWPVTLRNGQRLHEFLRSNPSWGGVSHSDTGAGIGGVLTDQMLSTLAERGGAMILYTHLGKARTSDHLLPVTSRVGLERLARHYHEGRLLVTTTRRLLGYCRTIQNTVATVVSAGSESVIDVQVLAGATTSDSDFCGLTFYCDTPERTRIRVNGAEIHEVRPNPPDQTGRRSISIPWKRLSFPF